MKCYYVTAKGLKVFTVQITTVLLSDTKNLQALVIKLIQGKQLHPDIFIIVIKLIQGK